MKARVLGGGSWCIINFFTKIGLFSTTICKFNKDYNRQCGQVLPPRPQVVLNTYLQYRHLLCDPR